MSPDGSACLLTVSQMSERTNRYESRIWRCDTASGALEPVTSGENRENRARWSPDGTKIAFVSHPDKTGARLHLLDLESGHTDQLLQLPEDIEVLEWSPDGQRLAYLAREREDSLHGPEDAKERGAKRVHRLFYRLDNQGWVVGRYKRLWVLGASPGSEPKRLTAGDSQVAEFDWAPDSEAIAYTSGSHETWDLDYRVDIYVARLSDGSAERRTPTDGHYMHPSWDPSGNTIAYFYKPDPTDGAHNARVGLIDLATGERALLTEELDRNALPSPPDRKAAWLDGYVYFTVENFGNTHLYRVPSEGGGKPEKVLTGDRTISAFDLGKESIVFVSSTPDEPPELQLASWSPSAERELTGLNRQFTADVELRRPERFVAVSRDGTEVEAWCMTPVGFASGGKYPMLLNIHGGPFTQYGNKFFDEFQVYAAAGYVVVYSNPRGSSGYSESWGRAIRGPKTKDKGPGFGTVDYDDLMAVVAEAVSRFPFIDEERMGVMGGSYGGYMTSWIISHTDKFKAACSERAVNNWYTMCFTSDLGAYFRDEFGPLYLDDPEEFLRVSPIRYVREINTPVLILHSEDDLRCPISQAEELYSALKLLGKEVEFVRFPGESHELSRSGGPRHRVERFEILVDWFDRKLKPASAGVVREPAEEGSW